MNRTRFLSIVMIAASILILGCSTTSPSRTSTALRVSGTAGTEYKAEYQAGSRSGTISTFVRAGRAKTIVQIPGGEFACQISKKDQAADLFAEIMRGEKCVFRAEAPAGTRGVRISQTPSGWRQETY